MILFDSGPLLAYVNNMDPHHRSAVDTMTDVLKGLYGRLVVTNYIIDEVLTLASVRTNSCIYGEEILHTIREQKNEKKLFFEIILDSEMITETETLFKKYCLKGLSFTDCSLIAVYNLLDIDYLFTFAREFNGIASVIPQME